MAATSAAGADSWPASTPALIRTCAPGETEPTFAELIGQCRATALHLEIHDQHLTSDPDYQAWLSARSLPAALSSPYRAYMDLVAAAVSRGVSVRRARVVSEPVSDYVRWEHALTGPVNIAAGEQVRWLPRRLASVLALPGNPYWVFDDRIVRFSLFDGNGEWHGHQYSDHPRVIAACTAAFEAVWEQATPHEDYQA
jgi:hypothetical protein